MRLCNTANPEHVNVVKLGTNAIRAYRKANREERLDLSNAKLGKADLNKADLSWSESSEVDLSKADLVGANLRGATLTGANLMAANLWGADLCESNLVAADLGRANLIGADLRRSRLHRADLREANLRAADLDGASLRSALLCDADMRGADFRRADLQAANLRNANLQWGLLSNADLTNAVFGHTTIDFADLSKTKGLQDVQHVAPSTIGLSTLEQSKNMIPEVFLRGCGMNKALVELLPEILGMARGFYSCFISYSHKNKSFARRLHDALQAQGIRCWLDDKNILPGEDIYRKVDEGIRLRDKVLLCASRESLTSAWVGDEIKHAFAKEKALFEQHGTDVLALIPLDLDGYIFEGWEHPKKNLVLERLVADFQGWDTDNAKFEATLERVVKALRADEGAREPPPEPKL